MLFVETRTAGKFVEGPQRTALLDALRERGFLAVIRSARLGAFEQALGQVEQVKELEKSLAAWADEEGDAPYVRGDIFWLGDTLAHQGSLEATRASSAVRAFAGDFFRHYGYDYVDVRDPKPAAIAAKRFLISAPAALRAGLRERVSSPR